MEKAVSPPGGRYGFRKIETTKVPEMMLIIRTEVQQLK